MVRVIITGGLGFFGKQLCKTIASTGKLGGEVVEEILLVDVEEPSVLPDCTKIPCVKVRFGDITDAKLCRELVDADGESRGNLSIFHLASIMSGQGEEDFDLCLRINLDSTRYLLEAARLRTARLKGSDGALPVRFMFMSSAAVFGETDDCPVGDTTKLVPRNTYGMTKACCELFVNDFTRKGFVDGRVARLPTTIVRPGVPNAASTSCFSSVVREPLQGVDYAIPVERELTHAVSSTRVLVRNLIKLHDVQWPADGPVDRSVTMPSRPITLGELADAVHRVVDPEDVDKLGKITDKIDPFLNRVVGGFACNVMCHDRATKLGLEDVPDPESMVREFIEDFGDKVVVKVRPLEASDPGPPAKRQRIDVRKRVAVVTGAGTGIGKSSAERLVTAAGFNAIVLVGRRAEPLAEVAEAICSIAAGAAPGSPVSIPRSFEGKSHEVEVSFNGGSLSVLCYQADVSREFDVKELFSAVRRRYGRCDLLFNNAGTGVASRAFEDLSLDAWKKCVDTNLTGSFVCSREAFKLMKEQDPQGGRIINNGSISADRPRPLSSPYTASKHAITGLTKCIALDGRAFDIACGQIDVGNAATPMTTGMAKGVMQPSGEKVVEPTMDVANVGDAVACMAKLPLDANILQMTVMATKMPFVGRG
eukprot:TRINITY_DN2486_c0_g1_i4.p1 TRINITY_DN2486_c0_g1~~TRINITY_DN2486_c0_g1_i4.p1  ORF type:complete len:649 (+),score=116.81 TRINITY_DN2486_c0_g1_i4:42-1988(+)